jgi:hypothetical protein
MDDGSFKGYRGSPKIKGINHPIEWTDELIAEYKKCRDDIIYFSKNYIKVVDIDEGLVNCELYPYQEKMVQSFKDNRFTIVLSCRQSGKTIGAVAYILHYILFNEEKVVVVLANKEKTSRKILSRIQKAFEYLPKFLQQGVKVWNKGDIELENGCKIFAEATSNDGSRGESAALLYLDEFAFVENAEEFYTATYPIISAGKESKIIITSTPNGIGNQFHRIWEGATLKKNSFTPIQVDWWDVPGRDEEWKKATIAATSELQFSQEFGNSFLNTGSTLVSGPTLLGLQVHEPLHRKENVCIYKEPIIGHKYVMTVDVAKGRGIDYSTFSIIDVTTKPFYQVVTYRDNKISPLLLPDVLAKYGNLYNQATVIVENNDQGGLTCNGLYQDLEYENTYLTSTVKSGGIGIYMDKKVKRIGCSTIKDIIEEGMLTIVDKETIHELTTFSAKGASYEATAGNHDDLAMTLVMFGYFTTLRDFYELTDDEMKNLLYLEKMQEIEDDVLPFISTNTESDHSFVDKSGQRWDVEDSYNNYSGF